MAAVLRAVCVLGLLALVGGQYLVHPRLDENKKVTPVKKVIELLKRLEAQVEEEGKKEAAEYDKFACFCKEQADDKLYAIEKSEAKIKDLTAQINDYDAQIAELNAKIADLGKKIGELDGDIKQASAVRAKEHEGYLKEAGDMDWAISAIERAIKALKDSKAQMTDAKLDLGQLDLVQLAASARTVLSALQLAPGLNPSEKQVKTVESLVQLGQPGTVKSYTYRSNDIIATLEGLLVQFKENKKELDDAEFKQQAAFDKAKLNMENEKAFAEKEKTEWGNVLAKKEEDLATAKEDLASETKAMDADKAFLAELTETCEGKAEDWDQRSKTRAAELAAIAEAIRALEEGVKPNWKANKKLAETELAQLRALRAHPMAPAAARPVSLLQRLSAVGQEGEDESASGRVLALITKASQRLNSPLLAGLALKIRVTKDHFVKVRGIIKDLLAKLKADAEAEASQKSACDKGMAAAIKSRDEAKSGLEEYAAETSRKESEKLQLTDEIAELSAAVADLKKALKEATELRAAEKAENEQTIAEAEEGKRAVEYAYKVLKDFYDSAAGELLQYVPPNADRDGKSVTDLAPPGWEGKYKGKQDEAEGILGILEVIQSDFERTINTVTDEEKAAEEKFEKFEQDTKSDIKAKEKEMADKEKRVAELTDELADLKDKATDAKKKLDSALSELEKLKEMCVDAEETYAERKAKREEEIEALKEAWNILDTWKS